MSDSKTIQRGHVAWIDLLRIVACFCVMLSHACDPFVGQFDNNYNEFLTGSLIGSFVRPCVPLFVMISGVLLLPVEMDMTTFYTKRAKRLLTPFIFWSLLLPVLFFLYVHSGLKIINPTIVATNYTWQMTLQKMYTFLFNFNFDTTALWYLYMLIGAYLFLPIISPWLKQASRRNVQHLLIIWGISMCVPYLEMAAPHLGYKGNYGSMGVLGVSYWNPYGIFYYFSGFIGYMILAHYLVRYPLNWTWKRTLSVAIPLFLTGYAITAGGFILTQKYFPGSYANLEIIWYFSGINVFLMTFSVFIIIQKIKVKASEWLKKVAALTFGVYLCHFVIVQAGYDIIYPFSSLPAFAKIIVIAVFTFTLSLFITWLMSLNRTTRKFIM